MRKIIKIEGVTPKLNQKTGERYWITHAIVDSGDECVGYGKDFDLGDPVMVFYHKGKIKMEKK